MSRPQITAIAAMSADGKITDWRNSPARFASEMDKAHLEAQIAKVDAVIFGANTLRAYGTSLPIRDPQLLLERERANKPSQPIHIVCSGSGDLSPDFAFFRQPLPRWLLTTPEGAMLWQNCAGFEAILYLDGTGNWSSFLQELGDRGVQKLAILGGGQLMASFAEQHLIDELWLTVCPILLGGTTAATPLGGTGFLQEDGIRLDLLEYGAIASELFLHYQVVH